MSTQLFTRKQVEERDRKDNAAIIIDNVVYDVTNFLEDHPGGIEVLINNAGRDASRCFHDVGHSDDAKAWREQFKIGEIVEEEKWEVISPSASLAQTEDELSWGGLLDVWGPPLALAFLATWAYMYLL